MSRLESYTCDNCGRSISGYGREFIYDDNFDATLCGRQCHRSYFDNHLDEIYSDYCDASMTEQEIVDYAKGER